MRKREVDRRSGPHGQAERIGGQDFGRDLTHATKSMARAGEGRLTRRVLILALGGTLLLQPWAATGPGWVEALTGGAPVASAAEATSGLKQTAETMITAGAKRIDYIWTGTRSGKKVQANVHVIEIDLTNPHVSLNVMSGTGNNLTNTASISSMTKATGAVAGVNADYFNMSAEGVPMGAQITSGTLMSSPSVLKGMYAFAIANDRTPVIDRFSFEGNVVAGGASFPLAGINQTSYMTEPASGSGTFSHVNAMYIYTSAWTAAERPNTKNSSTTPTEILVENGVVTQVAENGTLPIQPPANGYILRTHGTAAQFAKQNLTVGATVSASYNLTSLTTGAKKDPGSYQMMVGGHTILIEDGKASSFSRDVSSISGNSARSRTAVGYSRDSKKVYLVTAEDYGNSSGMTLKELQEVMVRLGVWKGLNLDGGGSTTMTARPLGEFEIGLAHPTENSGGTTERRVINGIGVYTSAPKGEVKGIKASGPSVVFLGQSAGYSLKAYDTYYNPIEPTGMTAQWSVDSGFGAINGSTFTPSRSGKTTLTAKSGSAKDELTVEVIGASQISEMSVAASSSRLQAGASINVPVRIKLSDGREMTVPAGSVRWELSGFTGEVKDGVLNVQSVSPDATSGTAIARYDGYSALVYFSAGDASASKSWETFEDVKYPITFQSTPNGTTGSVSVDSSLSGMTSKGLVISYDFTAGTGTKAAYAALNGEGRAVEGTPLAISADIYGDGSGNWVRAEVTDAAGKLHYVDLARPLDWTGWRTVKADLGALGMTYPVKVKRIYVANPEQGQSERTAVGQVAIDNIAFDYPAAAVLPPAPQIALTLGSTQATVGGTATKLDVAPIALNGVTYLPLKFVSDAIKGKVAWDNATKRATFQRGDKLLDLWLDQKSYVVNGKRASAEAAPIIRGGRTLVPVRLVSEQLGLQVQYDAAQKRITIQ